MVCEWNDAADQPMTMFNKIEEDCRKIELLTKDVTGERAEKVDILVQ